MAKETKEKGEHESKAEDKREGAAGEKREERKGTAKKKLHLHEIRSTQAHDGSIVHHHTYKESKDAPFAHPERGPVATSSSPEEAGQHVAEQFGMNQGGGNQEADNTGGAGEGTSAGAGGPEPQAV
jgi:hypothetical protein